MFINPDPSEVQLSQLVTWPMSKHTAICSVWYKSVLMKNLGPLESCWALCTHDSEIQSMKLTVIIRISDEQREHNSKMVLVSESIYL